MKFVDLDGSFGAVCPKITGSSCPGERLASTRAPKADLKMQKVSKAAWILFLVQCAAVAMLLGAYYGVRTNVDGLKSQVRALELRIAAAEQLLKIPQQEPMPRAPEDPSAIRPTQPIGAPSTQARASDKVEQAGIVARNQPASDKSPDAVVCVDKMTHTITSCENATNCLGSKSFDANYFRNLRTKLGIANEMMICDPKSSETAPVPVESN